MKIEPIKKQGIVLESLPSNQFKIGLEEGKIIRGYLSGRMSRNRIRVLPGDSIIVEIAPNIPISNQIGRIIFRK